MSKKTKVLVALFVVFGISFYFAPTEYYGENTLEKDSNHAVQVGKEAAYALFIGDKKWLSQLFIEPGISHISRTSLTEVDIHALRDKWEPVRENTSSSVWAPALIPDDRNLKMLALDRFEDFIVTTYAYTNDDEIVGIPGKQKLLFAICLRYIRPSDRSTLAILTRKIANLWFVPDFISRVHGTTGRWVCFDYRFNHTHAQYFQWFLASAQRFEQQSRQQTSKFFDALADTSGMSWLQANADSSLALSYDWAGLLADRQMNRIVRYFEIGDSLSKYLKNRVE